MNEENQEQEKTREERIYENISQSLETVLNKHGHSFQYSVIKRSEELFNSHESKWRLEGTEFPVFFKNEVFHIDFLLECGSFFLIAECKRVDPARGYWCFAKSPYTWRNHFGGLTQFDQIRMFSEMPQFSSKTIIAHTRKDITELGFEIRTGKHGDGTGDSERSAINKSVSQVLKGISGYINYLCDRQQRSKTLVVDRDYTFIPVIFTTAKIFVTGADIRKADLERGYLPRSSVKTEEKDWIWFNHNRSVNLSHGVRFDFEANKDQNEYFREFTRSIAIVGPNGIDDFLKTDFSSWLF